MNRFGTQAMEAWKTLAPSQFAQIPDPSSHFSQLGVQAEQEWTQLWPQLVGSDEPGEGFFSKAGRIEAAKLRAEEIIRDQWLTPPSEVQDLDEEAEAPDPLAEVRAAMRDLLEADD